MLSYLSRMAKDFKGYILLIVFLFFQTLNAVAAPDGKALFQANCAACHNPYKDATGPALNGVDSRVPSKEWLYKWIKNSASLIGSGDKYANDIYNKWNKTAMTAFPSSPMRKWMQSSRM
jgi:cytochrome c2